MDYLIPRNEAEQTAALQIYRSPRIGPKSYYKLMKGAASFGEMRARLEQVVIDNKIKDYAIADPDKIAQEVARGMEIGARLIAIGTAEYPGILATAVGAPPLIWVKGRVELMTRTALGIIGSRNASIEGIRITQGLAREAAQMGVVVVSGLARGIDTAAHQGALRAGTIAITAGGLDIGYPQENQKLQENIGEYGLLISEMPFGHQPQAANFPQRNRIIAGLVQAVLVIEGGIRSGTASTAREAADLGRDILAVPGHPFNGLANLPNQLLVEGATMIRHSQDLRQYFGKIIGTKPSDIYGAPKSAKPMADQGKAEHNHPVGAIGNNGASSDDVNETLDTIEDTAKGHSVYETPTASGNKRLIGADNRPSSGAMGEGTTHEGDEATVDTTPDSIVVSDDAMAAAGDPNRETSEALQRIGRNLIKQAREGRRDFYLR